MSQSPIPPIVIIDAITKKKKRADGRACDEMLAPYIDQGTLSQSSGSAYVEWHNTKVVCGIHGPRPTNKPEYSDAGRLRCDVRFTPFSTQVRDETQRPPPAPQTERERDLTSQIQTSLDGTVLLSSFPKSAVDLYFWVLEDGGNVLETIVAAASLALADAGIEMVDLVVCCSVGISRSESKDEDENKVDFLLDPTPAERAVCGSVVSVACLTSSGQGNKVSFMHQSGLCDVADSVQAISSCVAGCNQIRDLISEKLKSEME